jgi:glycosyltransferase involved in cell wall biosynthesis
MTLTVPVAPSGLQGDLPGNLLRGQLDLAMRDRIAGWAQDGADPEAPVALQLLDNGMPITRVLANLARADLADAGIGSGRHGFDIIIPGGLSPLARHVIQVRREADGAEIPGSPAVIEAAGAFDAGLQQAIALAVAAIRPDDDQDRVLSFMLEQADRLLQQRADAEAHRTERLTDRRLHRRWGDLARNAPVEAAAVVGTSLRALVIDERLPMSGRDAGSQAVLSHMRALQRLGYAVSFVAAEEMTGGEADRAALDAAGVACCAAPFYASAEDVLRRQAACFDVVYLHRAGIATRYLGLARRYMPRARIVYSVADLHHVRLERQAVAEERPELLAASRRMRLEECVAAWSADGVITHSADEAEILRHAVPEARVHQVPWAVAERATSVPFAARRGVAFIGSYTHTPNVDAARWLVEAVMPLIWQIDPDIECLLVGSGMPDMIRRLAGPGVVVLGEVVDLGSVFDRVRLSVAPLRYGAGVKGKVLDSLAAGVPCVMTPIAAEGLALPAELQALVREDPALLAGLICHLHRDEAAHNQVARAGLAMIRENHNESVVTDSLRAAIEGRGLPLRRTRPDVTAA